MNSLPKLSLEPVSLVKGGCLRLSKRSEYSEEAHLGAGLCRLRVTLLVLLLARVSCRFLLSVARIWI